MNNAQKIKSLIVINTAILIVISVGIKLSLQSEISSPSYIAPLSLSKQYIEEIPEGVSIEEDCEGWYCSQFSATTDSIERQDRASQIYIQDFADQSELNKIIFYADDYKINDQYCNIVDEELFEISIFARHGVDCHKLFNYE